MLPKLAEIFEITTDEILGLPPRQFSQSPSLPQESPAAPKEAPESQRPQPPGEWVLELGEERRGLAGIALWILITGGSLMLSKYLALSTPAVGHPIPFWDALWASGLVAFGLPGLWPNFSLFRVGCGLFGGYSLLVNLGLFSFPSSNFLTKELLLPLFLMLFGAILLVKALLGPAQRSPHRKKASVMDCNTEDGSFHCELSFGENHQIIQLPQLRSGSAAVSFGDLTVDLRSCQEIDSGCLLKLESAFGHLRLILPKNCIAEPRTQTAFGNVNLKGCPDSGANVSVFLDCDASFGEIEVEYR